MVQARSLLLERFDGEVRRRLRLADERAKEAVAQHREHAKALTRSILGPGEASRARISEAAALVRGRPADPVSFLRLDAAFLPANLSDLASAEGWWFAYRFETTCLKPQQELVHLILVREGDRFRALPRKDSALFLKLPAREEPSRRPTGISMANPHEQALAAIREEILAEAEQRSSKELDLARRLKARSQLEKAEREYRRKLTALRDQEQTGYLDKDRALADLSERAKVTERRTLVASA